MKIRKFLCIFLMILIPAMAVPQSGGTFVMEKSVIAGGGTKSTGGTFTLEGTIGQSVAGITSTGGTFHLQSGFWADGSIAGPTPTPMPGAGLEGDLAPRFAGDGVYRSNDLAAIQLFFSGVPFSTEFNEFQRADNAPFATRGDGVLNATDVAQMRLYIATLAEPQPAGGPTVPNPAPPPFAETADGLDEANGRVMRIVAGRAKAREAVTISIEMDAVGDETIVSFTLNFDPAILGNPVVRVGKDAAEGTSLITNLTNASGGQIGVLVDSDGGFRLSGRDNQIITVTFDVAKGAPIGTTVITFSSSLVAAAMSDFFAQPLATKYENADVFIAPGGSGTTQAGHLDYLVE